MKTNKWLMWYILIFSFLSMIFSRLALITFVLSIVALIKYKLVSKQDVKKSHQVEVKEKNNYRVQPLIKNHSENINKDPNDNYTVLDFNYTKARKLSNSFVVLDFETTGLNYEEDEIIQYAFVEYKDGKIVDQKNEYFKPYFKEISNKIERITGLNDEFLMDKPFFERKHAEELKNKLESSTIVAHNAPFDMKFLIYSLHNLGIEHNKFRVYDTLTFSRKYITETKNHKLQTLKKHFNLGSGHSHDALNDAKATGELALLLIERQNNR